MPHYHSYAVTAKRALPMLSVSLYDGYVICYTVNIALVTVSNRPVTVAYVTCYTASWITATTAVGATDVGIVVAHYSVQRQSKRGFSVAATGADPTQRQYPVYKLCVYVELVPRHAHHVTLRPQLK